MRDNLSKRGLQLDNKCFICQSNSESINHLFLHCPVASDIWHMFFNIFGLYCYALLCQRCLCELEAQRNLTVPSGKSGKWYLLAFFWRISKERNNRCFDWVSTSIGFFIWISLALLFCCTFFLVFCQLYSFCSTHL